MDGNLTSAHNFTMYRNTDALYCKPEIKMMYYVNY